MEPPIGIWASLWNFLCFLPYFIGLLILGLIKGLVLCPLICVLMTIANSAIILGLWPLHFVWTNYSIIRSKQFGPVMKIVLCLFISIALILSPVIGIVGSVIGGAAFGFLAPMFATFKGIEEGKKNSFYHCIYDGTVDTVKEAFTIITDFKDVLYHSYFSFMADVRRQGPEEGKYFEIRLLDFPGAIIAGVLGIVIDFPVISLIAIFKSPYMLFKGWHRLFHDCIGREGPFLESICVPFAGLAIILWPLAVAGAVLGSIVSSVFLGAYAAVVVYQESSLWFGLRYIVATLSIYDEYSNDVLDMPEGSCFPRPQYRKKNASLDSRSTSLQKPDSFKQPPARSASINTPMVELKPLELLDGLLKICQENGEVLVREGLITLKDLEDAKSSKDTGKVISIGLPAYSLLQMLLNSAKANSTGILLSDNVTEITSSNRPKDVFFDWFLNPLVIIKDQIKAENLTEDEEDYLRKVVLLSGDTERLKISNVTLTSPTGSEIKKAELDAFARRLRGITKSLCRYPTFKRRFESKIKTISEDLAKKNGNNKPANGNGQQPYARSKSAFVRMFSQKSFKNRTDNGASNRGSQYGPERDVEIV